MRPTCHPQRNYKALGRCASCYQRHYTALHPEYAAKQKISHRKASQRYSESHKRQRKIRHIVNTYGLKWTDYLKMTKKGCSICKRQGKLVVDHHHGTGRVRGLLCACCNIFMGKVDQNFGVLKRIVEYV